MSSLGVSDVLWEAAKSVYDSTSSIAETRRVLKKVYGLKEKEADMIATEVAIDNWISSPSLEGSVRSIK